MIDRYAWRNDGARVIAVYENSSQKTVSVRCLQTAYYYTRADSRLLTTGLLGIVIMLESPLWV